MDLPLTIIPADLLSQYRKSFDDTAVDNFNNLHDSELSLETFSFYTSVSAVYSSKIEGEDIELDSYIKHKRFGVKYMPDHTQKIDDLYNTYLYAQSNKLTPENLMHAHELLTKNILDEQHRGQLRKNNMFVMTSDGKIEYVAAVPSIVGDEMQKFYQDLKTLLQANLKFSEVLFFAAMLHLVFVKIHPLDDGNGRTARLLEKWFLAEKLGGKAWFIQSEKHYYDNHSVYYSNLRKLGLEYPELDYTKALDFALMLPSSLEQSG